MDTGLHYYGFTRDKALEYFSKYAWDETDVAKKEVKRTRFIDALYTLPPPLPLIYSLLGKRRRGLMVNASPDHAILVRALAGHIVL